MRKMMRKTEGFTLIELMIVILIIAILVAIAVPVFLNARSNAQTRTCQANLRTLEGAVNTYMADANNYPANVSPQMTEGQYKVLKQAPECPTNEATYPLTGGGGNSFPAIVCPDSITGHEI